MCNASALKYYFVMSRMLYDLNTILLESSKTVTFILFETNSVRTVGHSAKDAGKMNLIMYFSFKDHTQRKQKFLIW